MRHALPAAALALLLLIGGCAQYHTPSGPMLGTAPPLSWTFPVNPQPLPGGAAPPQASAAGADDPGPPVEEPPPAADLSGTYRGDAVLTFSTGNPRPCRDHRITAFRVDGREARLFGFRGTIAPDGTVTMQSGDRWLSGRFIGRTFQGQLWQRFPNCIWAVSLQATS
jgi:hypothetical protein